MRKISSDLTYRPEWETDSVSIEPLLDQPFYYLGHGAQVYAFASEDNQTVLKFYRHNRACHPLHPIRFLIPGRLKEDMIMTHNKRQGKRIKDFNSYKLAADNLAQETGLLYAHLNKSDHIEKKVVLFDKIGVRHTLDLNKYEFILQKKASLVYPSLEKWIANGDTLKAKKALSQLVSLLRSRSEKGIFDKDPNLKTNFGFVGETPIQIDIGRYKKELEQKDLAKRCDELVRITDHLCHWLDEQSPELAKHIREDIYR